MNNIVLGNRYTLNEKISEGGMSTIYKAYCNVLNRTVAVKILKQEFSNDEEFLRKFNNEAKAAASLNHPNIIGVYDVGSDDDVSYIVMEYVDGKNIKQMIKEKGAFTEKNALEIIRQICLALKEAHSNSIVHRDIKPHNIMINKSGIVKVGDFGIAKAASTATITTSDSIMGSVHYISPEQAKGSYVDKRSDIYSLGIVFYEMLTGTVPYKADQPIDVALKHINEEVVIPQIYKNTMSLSVQNMILKMTQKNPAKRYLDVAQVLDDISKIQNNTGQVIYFEEEEDDATKVIKIPKKEIEEKKRDIRKQKEGRKIKLPLILTGITILLLAILFYMIYSSELFNSITGKHNVVIPNIVGKNVEEATKELEEVGLKLNVISEREDIQHDKGIVLEQNPQAKIEMKKGEEVSVIISKEPENLVIVPNVVDKYVKEAQKELENVKLKVVVEYEHSETIEQYKVISQSLKEGTKAKEEDTIKLVVSDGQETKKEKIPNLVGLTIDDANKKVGNFSIGNISYKEDENKENGVIIYQNPQYNTMQEIGSSIDIVVNKIYNKKQENTNSNESSDNNANDNSSNAENNDNKNSNSSQSNEVITQTMSLVLPAKDNVLLSLVDKSTGNTVVSSNITTRDGEQIQIKVKGYKGQTKQYDIYLAGQYYATTGSVTF